VESTECVLPWQFPVRTSFCCDFMPGMATAAYLLRATSSTLADILPPIVDSGGKRLEYHERYQ
jgi:hypothetical protein